MCVCLSVCLCVLPVGETSRDCYLVGCMVLNRSEAIHIHPNMQLAMLAAYVSSSETDFLL